MNLIVAVDENWGIGYLGKIQWNIKEDMTYFKNKTLNKTIIMGRKTLDSFKNGRPLKGLPFFFADSTNQGTVVTIE